MSTHTEETKAEEIEVYVCFEYEKENKTCRTPVLILTQNSYDQELVGFEYHPMRKEILALADLAGRDDGGEGKNQWKLGEDGRGRFSNDFFLPAEWFIGCEWEE